MDRAIVYRFIPIAAVLIAGLIQTAVVAITFTAVQWHVAALLGLCVWIVCAADGFVYHEITRVGGTRVQYGAVLLSVVCLVLVLAIDLVVLFSPSAFNTTDAVVSNLKNATGLNLAFSIAFLLVWLFTSRVNETERVANEAELLLIRERRIEYLQSERARELIYNDVENDHATRMAKTKNVSTRTLLENVKGHSRETVVPSANGNGQAQHQNF